MVKFKRARIQSSDMGSASPQSKPLTKVGVGDPGKSKGRKSKLKKSGRDKEADPVADRAALEEESARALMLLSTSALQNDSRGPYYNLDDKGAPPRQDDPASDRTQVDDGQPARELGKRQHRKRKDKEKRKKHKETEGSHETQIEHLRPSTPPEEGSASHVPTHPLDEEPSDDEMVQEYETGRCQDQPGQLADISAKAVQSSEMHSGDSVSKDVTNNSQNRKTSSEMRIRNGKKPPSKKRKRQTIEPAADQLQSQGLPIDPDLHAFDALPSYPPDPLDTLNATALPELQQRKRNKRRKADQTPSDAYGEREYNNPSNVNDGQDEDGGMVVQGLEDQAPIYGDFDLIGNEGLDAEAPQPNADSQRKKNGKLEKTGPGGKGGFSATEIAKLDNYRDQYCASHDLIIPGFNHLIQLNVKSNDYVNKIFNEIQDLFPDRTRASVQRFCRRHFHNFHARGVWTPEEEADLKAAVAQKGTSWKAIGELLGRFSEDCRDRYRNYLAPSAEHRNRDAWTEKEVINLSHSVLECMHLLKTERQRAKEEEAGHAIPLSDTDSDQEAEDLKLINWQTVSDLMGRRGTARSRIQCSFKWSKIKKADRDRYLAEVKQAAHNLRDLEQGNYSANNMKRSTGWRLKAAAKRVAHMKPGDKLDLLNAILASATHEEDNIPWRVIGDAAFRQRWSFSERKAGWFALKKQQQQQQQQQQQTAASSSSAAAAENSGADYRQIAQQLLQDLLAEGGVDERWDHQSAAATMAGVDGPPARRPRQRSAAQRDPFSGAQAGTASNGHDPQREHGAGFAYENNDAAAVHVGAAPAPIANMPGTRQGAGGGGGGGGLGRSYASGSESPNSLFDGDDHQQLPPTPAFERQRQREVSPELAGRIQLLQAA